MRSSPHVRLAAAISAISRWSSAGMHGRPCRRALHARRGDTGLDASTQACPDAQSSAARATRRIEIAGRARFATRYPCAAVGSCVRCSKRAASAGRDSRRPVGSSTCTSAAVDATGQRGARAPYGTRLAMIPSAPAKSSWLAGALRNSFLRSTAVSRRSTSAPPVRDANGGSCRVSQASRRSEGLAGRSGVRAHRVADADHWSVGCDDRATALLGPGSLRGGSR
jgi:hypothetical protein